MNGKGLANLLLGILIVVLVIVGLANLSSALTPRGLFVNELSPDAAGKLELTDYKVASDEANKMVSANFQVSNRGEVDAQGIEVSCEFFSGQGRYLDRKTWLLAGILGAGASTDDTQHDRRFIHTEARAINCQISAWKPVAKPLFSVERHAAAGHGAEAAGGGHGEAAHGDSGGHH